MTIIIIILLLLPSKSVESAANISLPGCPESCGGILIPYPFGIGPNCSISSEFEISCNTTGDGTQIPYLKAMNFYTVLNISIPHGQARLNLPVTYHCYNITRDLEINGPYWEIESLDNPFWLNKERNKFIVTGCNTVAYLHLDFNNDLPVGCLSTCNSRDSLNKYGPSCSGIGCCRTEIPMATNYFYIFWDDSFNNSKVYNFSRCSYAMVTEDTGSFNTNYITTDELINQRMPVVFDWTLGNITCKHAQTNQSSYACKSDHSDCLNSGNGGYICNCSKGYEGNPYLQGGCQGLSRSLSLSPPPSI
jgi:Wall-associated receptor kinase galacturonan-binding